MPQICFIEENLIEECSTSLNSHFRGVKNTVYIGVTAAHLKDCAEDQI